MNPSEPGQPERISALFQSLVAQQANMAAMCLGQSPDEAGQQTLDLQGARFFIDQLEMLEVKTKGNLTKDEESFLKQALTSLRLAFVEIAHPGPPSMSTSSAPSAAPPPASPAPESPQAPQETEDSRRKFSKKY